MFRLLNLPFDSSEIVAFPSCLRSSFGMRRWRTVARRGAWRTQYGSIRTETDFFDLHVTRLVAQLSGLIRKYKGKFIPNRECHRLLAECGPAGMYPRLLQTYATEFNLGYPDLDLIQRSFLFTLYLLHRFGDEWRTNSFYEDTYLRAFPVVVKDAEPSSWDTPENVLRRCYSLLCLDRFAAFMGLIGIERESDLLLDQRFNMRTLPPMDEAVVFQL